MVTNGQVWKVNDKIWLIMPTDERSLTKFKGHHCGGRPINSCTQNISFNSFANNESVAIVQWEENIFTSHSSP